MTLTVGTGPFGHRPAGHFNFAPPDHVVYVESFPRRVRAVSGDTTVVESDRVLLVHEGGQLPRWAFPAGDVRVEAARPEPAADGHVQVPWEAVDAWFEEDEQVFVHVRDPYHRIDVVPTSRHVVISVDDVELAASNRPRGLYETSLPVRWYIPRDDVHMDRLERSATITHCAYKGTPVHWSARAAEELVDDVGWSYDEDVRREAEAVRGMVAFYGERVDTTVDGVRQERPLTPWSR